MKTKTRSWKMLDSSKWCLSHWKKCVFNNNVMWKSEFPQQGSVMSTQFCQHKSKDYLSLSCQCQQHNYIAHDCSKSLCIKRLQDTIKWPRRVKHCAWWFNCSLIWFIIFFLMGTWLEAAKPVQLPKCHLVTDIQQLIVFKMFLMSVMFTSHYS